MSLRTAVSLCTILVVAYYILTGLRGTDSHGSNPWGSFVAPWEVFTKTGPASPSWTRFNLGRATFECPCALSLVPDQRSLQEKKIAMLDQFKGATQTCEIIYLHAYYPTLRGENMLDSFSRVLDVLAPQRDFSRYPSKSGAVMLNGVRARRFDFDHPVNSWLQHARFVFYSKGYQAWGIGVDSREETPDVEQTFQRMALSLQTD